nr:GNAT family N-acetyltransferase [Puniceibacterium confluentis]
MAVTIKPASPRDPQAEALLLKSHALMRSLYAPEDSHFLDVDALCAPDITLFLAAEDGQALGCIALRTGERCAEVKSFFVDPAARGRGIGQALLDHLFAVACAGGVQVLRLETGVGLDAAARLYRANGFVPSGPFGQYAASAASLFFEKSLVQSR